MNIANPIYDTAFKFLMEDMMTAKLFISALIGEKVLELEYAPQEYTRFKEEDERKKKLEEISGGINTTVFRLDFAAKIATPGGYKTVMIEVQKAKLSNDIMRFRKYLGEQYGNDNNTSDEKQLKARQIYCIFLLGYDIGIPGHPVLCVDHKITDAGTAESLDDFASNEFIYGLHHRSWIVQIRQLKNNRRSRVEKLLSVFDQTHRILQDDRMMNFREDEYPEEFLPIIRRLQMAGENAEIRRKMQEEYYFWEEMRGKERIAEQAIEALEEKNKENVELKEEKDKALEEKDKALKEKDEALKEKDEALKALEKKDKAFAEQVKAIAEKDKMIEELLKKQKKD